MTLGKSGKTHMKKVQAAGLCALFLLSAGCSDNIKNNGTAKDVLEEVTEPVATTVTATEPPVQPPSGVKLLKTDKFEVYEKVYLKDVLSEQVTPLSGEEILDTSSVGSHKEYIEYNYGGEKLKSEVSYTVSDTTPPVVLHSGDGSEVLLGESFNISKQVGVADNFDSNVKLDYTGTVDTSACGSYPVTVTARDGSGNKTSWDITVKVVSEYTQSEPSDSRTLFSDFKSTYAGENAIPGIDISRWQGDVDFEAVKAAGCEFVFMRIGYYDFEYTVDSCFAQNIAGAKKAGLKVGVYLYTMANTEEEIRENVQWIHDILDGETLDLPVVFDWEEFYNFQEFEMSINDLNEYYRLFKEEAEKLGYKSMLYSSKNYLNNFWYSFEDSPVWLAHYTDHTDYTGDYAIWQMCSDGRIDGIDGNVDLNILYTDRMKEFE